MSGNSLFIRISRRLGRAVARPLSLRRARGPALSIVNECSYYGNTAPAFQGTSHRRGSQHSRRMHGVERDWLPIAGNQHERQSRPRDAAPFGQRHAVARDPDRGCVHAVQSGACRLRAQSPTATLLSIFWGDGRGVLRDTKHRPEPVGSVGFRSATALGSTEAFSRRATSGGPLAVISRRHAATASDSSRVLGVRGIRLAAEENSGPAITAIGSNNVWYQSKKWIRGSWPMSFTATDPSGVCATRATVGSQVIVGPGDPTPNQSTWQQCPNQTLGHELDTTAFPDGPVPLTLFAQNAAGVASAPSERIYVDNRPVSLSLSGLTDAPSTDGTQYITASATAGPSGDRLDRVLTRSRSRAFVPGSRPPGSRSRDWARIT